MKTAYTAQIHPRAGFKCINAEAFHDGSAALACYLPAEWHEAHRTIYTDWPCKLWGGLTNSTDRP